MSFLDALQKQKSKLAHTETIVKTITGDVLKEDISKTGDVFIEHLPQKSTGFVVDLKPDLQVAKIVTGLYMGSQDVTQDEKLLTEYNIKYILSIGIVVPKLFCTRINYEFVEALDIPEFDMNVVFDRTHNFINDIINQRKNVYVHCNAGVSRSAAIVIAYLIRAESLSYDEAYNHVKACRSVIKPNDGFVKQLKLYASNVNKN